MRKVLVLLLPAIVALAGCCSQPQKKKPGDALGNAIGRPLADSMDIAIGLSFFHAIKNRWPASAEEYFRYEEKADPKFDRSQIQNLKLMAKADGSLFYSYHARMPGYRGQISGTVTSHTTVKMTVTRKNPANP